MIKSIRNDCIRLHGILHRLQNLQNFPQPKNLCLRERVQFEKLSDVREARERPRSPHGDMSILSFAEPYNDLQYNITTPRTHMEMMIMCNGKAPDQMPLSYWVNVHKRWVAMKKRYHHKFQFFCQTHELNERKGAWKFKAEQFRINFVVSKDSVSELFCVKHV